MIGFSYLPPILNHPVKSEGNHSVQQHLLHHHDDHDDDEDDDDDDDGHDDLNLCDESEQTKAASSSSGHLLRLRLPMPGNILGEFMLLIMAMMMVMMTMIMASFACNHFAYDGNGDRVITIMTTMMITSDMKVLGMGGCDCC